MLRRARIDAPGALHHIICRGIERKAIRNPEGFCYPASAACESPQPALLLGRKGTGVQYHVSCQQNWHTPIKTAPASRYRQKRINALPPLFSVRCSPHLLSSGSFYLTHYFIFSYTCPTQTRVLYESKIILIDGERMAELMIDHKVGMSPLASYEIRKIDTDYFIED